MHRSHTRSVIKCAFKSFNPSFHTYACNVRKATQGKLLVYNLTQRMQCKTRTFSIFLASSVLDLALLALCVLCA